MTQKNHPRSRKRISKNTDQPRFEFLTCLCGHFLVHHILWKVTSLQVGFADTDEGGGGGHEGGGAHTGGVKFDIPHNHHHTVTSQSSRTTDTIGPFDTYYGTHQKTYGWEGTNSAFLSSLRPVIFWVIFWFTHSLLIATKADGTAYGPRTLGFLDFCVILLLKWSDIHNRQEWKDRF